GTEGKKGVAGPIPPKSAMPTASCTMSPPGLEPCGAATGKRASVLPQEPARRAAMFAPGSVLLHDTLSPAGRNLLFTAPRDILVAHDAAGVHDALRQLDAACEAGLHAAGYLAYEMGFVFEERLAPLLPPPGPTPLLWLGLYDAPEHPTADEIDRRLAAMAGAGTEAAIDVVPRMDEAAYETAFDRIKDLIAAGDTYQ